MDNEKQKYEVPGIKELDLGNLEIIQAGEGSRIEDDPEIGK